MHVQLDNALKEFKKIEQQEEVLHAKHEKEEFHIEEVEEQVVQVIEKAEQQDNFIEASGDEINGKGVSPSMAEIEHEHHSE